MKISPQAPEGGVYADIFSSPSGLGALVIGELMWINLTAMMDGFSLEILLVILNLLKHNETR